MAPEHPVTLCSMQRPAPGSPVACHTWAAVDHKTSPTRVLRLPRPCEHSPVQLAPGLPSDGFALAHCDAVSAPIARDRCVPVMPMSAHRVDHLLYCSCCSSPLFLRAPRSLRVPAPLTAGFPMANVFRSPARCDFAVSSKMSASSLPLSSALSVPE